MERRKCWPSYYSVLGVSRDSSVEEIRRAYRKLAMQWHPDRWTRRPSLLGEAKTKFQQIQEAYSVLSDQRKRSLYDAGLFDPDEEEDEGFADFLQEMMSLVTDVRRQNKSYSMNELHSMFWEMARDFEFQDWSLNESPLQTTAYGTKPWICSSSSISISGSSSSSHNSAFDESGARKRPRWDANPLEAS